jgi:hypothetical protein
VLPATHRPGIALAVLSALAALPAAAQQVPVPAPPPESAVCPGIDWDAQLCIADPLSGNCDDFVAMADRLGGLYRAELAKLPDSKQALLTTVWWGCGPGDLGAVKRLLVRIGSPSARKLLATEPYRSLPPVQIPPPPPPNAPPSADECEARATQLERNECIGVTLQAARAYHQSAFAHCKAVVDAPLRGELLAEESSFEATLAGRCDAQAADSDEKAVQAFLRSRCLYEALHERTRAMLEAHPECAGSN